MKNIKRFKKIIALLSVVMMCVSFCVAASAAEKTVITLQIKNPTMTVNGISQEIDPGRGTVPVIVNGRTLVPIRAIIEALGGSVGWDGEKSEVSLNYKGDIIRLVIDSETAFFNDSQSTLDVAPTTINERTMLPIRYIAESFKFDVDWDGETSTVKIVSKENTGNQEAVIPTAKDENFDVYTNPDDLMASETEEPEEDTQINPEDEEFMNPEDEEDMNPEDDEEVIE